MYSQLTGLLLIDYQPRLMSVSKLIYVAAWQTVMIVTLAGCDMHYRSSVSVGDSLRRGLLIATYAIPDDDKLGDYVVLEAWVEIDQETTEEQLVIRLKGPHHGGYPRVEIAEPEGMVYRSIWSKRDGPPYELWTVPDPIPDLLRLRRGDAEIELVRRQE